MNTLARHEDGPPNLEPPSSPRATEPGSIARRVRAAEEAATLTSNPVLVGALMGDLLVLAALRDGIGALQAAQAAVTTGDREALRVELHMALRCVREALEGT